MRSRPAPVPPIATSAFYGNGRALASRQQKVGELRTQSDNTQPTAPNITHNACWISNGNLPLATRRRNAVIANIFASHSVRRSPLPSGALLRRVRSLSLSALPSDIRRATADGGQKLKPRRRRRVSRSEPITHPASPGIAEPAAERRPRIEVVA